MDQPCVQDHQNPKYHRLSLFDFIEEETIDGLLNQVVKVGQIPVFIQEPMGRKTYFASKSPRKPAFCWHFESQEVHRKECKKFLAESVHRSATYGRPFVGTCPYGLSFAFGPLILKRGVCTAALVAGYVRVQDKPFQEKSASSDKEESTSDQAEAERLFKEIPVVESIQMHALADFLCVISAYLMKLVPLRERNFNDFLNSDMAAARNLIHDFYQQKSENKKSIPVLKLEGNEEGKLIQAVARGQRNVAEVRLRDILDKLLVVYKDNHIAIKGHIMELAVLISRAPLLCASYNEGETFSLNHLPAVNPPKGNDYLILKHWVLNVLHQSLDIIERKHNCDIKAMVVREVISYINSNLDKILRLEDVATAVSFSAQHLSRMFIEEIGMSINNYIVQARIEESKRLLRTTQLTIVQIAERLNYYDSSYFSKAFKKNTGLSPLAYRNHIAET